MSEKFSSFKPIDNQTPYTRVDQSALNADNLALRLGMITTPIGEHIIRDWQRRRGISSEKITEVLNDFGTLCTTYLQSDVTKKENNIGRNQDERILVQLFTEAIAISQNDFLFQDRPMIFLAGIRSLPEDNPLRKGVIGFYRGYITSMLASSQQAA